MTDQPAQPPDQSDNGQPQPQPQPQPQKNDAKGSEFLQLSTEEDLGIIAEFWVFLKEEKRWWLSPIIVACLAIVGLAWFTSTGAYPFIYSLF